jgi:hypothetical protein
VPPTPRNVPLFFNLALPRPSMAPPRTYCVYGLKNWSIFDKPVSESDFFYFDFFKKMVYRFTDLPVSTNFNHCRPTGLPVSVPIY